MKQQQAVDLMLSGRLVAIGDYRDFDVREVGTNGTTNVIAQTFVLLGREVVQIDNWQPKGTRKESVTRPTFQPGQKVVVQCSSLERSRFGTRARGEVFPLEK